MRTVFWPLVGTTWMQTIASIMYLTVPIMAPALLDDFGFTPGHVGLYTALVFLGAMPVSLFMGALSKRFGALRVMQTGLLMSATGLLLSNYTFLPLLLACSFLLGMGYGPNTPGAAHILARITKAKDRPLVFSIKQSGAPLGGFLAGLLIPWIAVTVGWREALIFAAALGIITVFMVQPLRANADDDRQPGSAISIHGVWQQLHLLAGNRVLRRLTLASFIYAGIQNCLLAYMVIYLVDHVGLDLIRAGFAYACMHLIGVGARIAWGWIADRFIPAAIVLAGLGIASAIFVLIIAQFTPQTPFWVIVTISAAAGATAASWNGVFLAEVIRAAPPNQGAAATGGVIFFTYFGLVVGPTVFAAVISISGGYTEAFYVIAGAIFAAALMILPRRDKTSPDPHIS